MIYAISIFAVLGLVSFGVYFYCTVWLRGNRAADALIRSLDNVIAAQKEQIEALDNQVVAERHLADEWRRCFYELVDLTGAKLKPVSPTNKANSGSLN